MRQLKLLSILLLMVSFVSAQERTYNKIIKVTLDKETLHKKSSQAYRQTGLLIMKQDSIILDGMIFKVIKQENLEHRNGFSFKSFLLTAPKSIDHKLYDCIVSYRGDTLYMIEFWKSDLTCTYYILNHDIGPCCYN